VDARTCQDLLETVRLGVTRNGSVALQGREWFDDFVSTVTSAL